MSQPSHPADKWGPTITVSSSVSDALDIASAASGKQADVSADVPRALESYFSAPHSPPCHKAALGKWTDGERADGAITDPPSPFCQNVKVDTSTFDEETKDSLLRVHPQHNDPWFINEEYIVSPDGKKYICSFQFNWGLCC